MTKKEFAKITDRIGHAYKDPFTEGQFEEWFKEFGDDDYQVVDDAVSLMVREYKYFPMIATLRQYIRTVRDTEKEEISVPVQGSVKPPSWFMGIGRFFSWLYVNKIHYSDWSVEKIKQEKAKFEKEYPNWKPPKTTQGMAKLGSVLGESIPE